MAKISEEINVMSLPELVSERDFKDSLPTLSYIAIIKTFLILTHKPYALIINIFHERV